MNQKWITAKTGVCHGDPEAWHRRSTFLTCNLTGIFLVFITRNDGGDSLQSSESYYFLESNVERKAEQIAKSLYAINVSPMDHYAIMEIHSR